MKFQRFASLIVATTIVLAPLAAAAQSPLATADAAAFLGTWSITVDSPQGAFEQTLSLKDEAGKVAGEISNQMQPGATAITDISRAGTDLVLRFQGDFQGQAFTAKITMTPDGSDKAAVSFDVMDGQFVMQGTGVKK
jgi:hypothetical protein